MLRDQVVEGVDEQSAAVDEPSHHPVAGDHQVFHAGAEVGQRHEERVPELTVRLAAHSGEQRLVVDVALSLELVDQVGNAVRVPYSVVYDLSGDRISALRIYFPMSLPIEQLTT